jgi:uncharacterized membrane protein YraQ (UPF0718 family)
MPDFTTLLPRLLQGGLGNLAAYLAAHVLLCLLPAFYIAGAMTAMIPKPLVTRFLGRGTPRFVSYPAAALAGSVLAVCSCTIVPLFAGIHRKGAGIGPAVTFLFFAPAANILALVYTGNVIGPDLALARLLLSLAFGIGIGLIMALLFHDDDAAHDRATDALFAAQAERGLNRGSLAFMLTGVLLLLAGTLKLDFLAGAWADVHLPLPGAAEFQSFLERLVPFDAASGEEGVSVQGAVLILLLLAVGYASWRGFERIQEGWNRWTGIALALTAATLAIAALRIDTSASGLAIGVTGRFVGVLAVQFALFRLARTRIGDEELRDWLWESWRFVKQIFPLLVAGVFVVGMLRVVIRPEWIEALAGANTVLANLTGVAFGVVMYFPTLVEVPIARMFLDLGMHRGPLLAYLMADPELSLQSILILTAIIGRLKTWSYVALVALFSVLAGLAYGAWIDGADAWLIAASVAGFLGTLSVALWLANGRLAHRHA